MYLLIQLVVVALCLLLVFLALKRNLTGNREQLRRANRRNKRSLELLREHGAVSQTYYREWDKNPHSKETRQLRVLSKKTLNAYMRFPIDYQTA